jgi:hypothetical protein
MDDQNSQTGLAPIELVGQNKVIQFSRSKPREFRKCIHTMADSQLVGIGHICRSLSQNSSKNQFAE